MADNKLQNTEKTVEGFAETNVEVSTPVNQNTQIGQIVYQSDTEQVIHVTGFVGRGLGC